MRANRILCLLWVVVATIYALRVLVMAGTGRDASGDTVPMFTAIALAKPYEMDGEDK